MGIVAVPWAIVVPVKRLALAKSRLQVADEVRTALALAMTLDTVAAALACDRVGLVVTVTDDQRAAAQLASSGAVVVADEPDAGLNPALAHGARVAAARVAAAGVAALSADLPALRPAELGAVLDAAADHPAALVADADGDGTTLLTARPASTFRSAFGVGSRAAHTALGATDLSGLAGPSLRRDVDTLEHLGAAAIIGCGPATAEILRAYGLVPDATRAAEAPEI
ncbi:MAG: 2-phospho-L-lactate/phosphoenolpyruvate guanylyltransferase [Frankiaceae bacterium]|nr:2-phospho-L-lactate/phosphoenolpyruvate guanylyltransferase [Frankiaceae bacterium]